MTRINPFRPNAPVNPGMFVGRFDEVMQLERGLIQTRAEQPENFLMIGERGIGKTSFFNYIRYVAKGLITLNSDKLNFLVVDIVIDQRTTIVGLIKSIKLGLQKALGDSNPIRKIFQDGWAFLKQFEVGGLKVKDQSQEIDNEMLLEEFSYSLAELVNKICDPNSDPDIFNDTFDGVLILVDEVDNSSKELQLGVFFKLLLEKIQRRSCNRFMIGLAGLPEVRDVLHQSHPSSLRMFQQLTLNRLSSEEINKVIDRCLSKANEVNEKQTAIDDEARNDIVLYSEGFPHFIQQFGYSAFDKDTDGLINSNDVKDGAFGPGGGFELIGDRYYRDDFFKKIQKDSYREVLTIMADKLSDWINKKDIREKFKGKDTTLNNAIQVLRKNHIILSKEGVKGVYRLQHRAFAVWIKYYSG